MPSSPVKGARPSAEADFSDKSRNEAGQSRGRLLLLIPTTSYKAHDFLAAAERLGVEVAVGSDRRQILEAYSDGLTTTIDFKRRDQGRRQIVDYARKYPLIGVIGVEDVTVILAAEAAQDLSLPHNSPASVMATIGKQMQRRILDEAGLNIPEHRLVSLGHGLEETAAELRYPVVLKPLNLSASRGVIRADDRDAFLKAAARISKILKRNDASLLVERFIPGREVAMEGLLVAGELKLLALFDKPDPMDGPFFEETLYITPSRLPDDRQREIFEVAQAAADALGLKEGPVHAEFRINDEGVWPLEMAARTIGGLCSRSLSFEAGMSLEECVLRHALGDLPEDLALKEGASGVMMIPIPRAGTLRAVHGTGGALAVEGVSDLQITIPIGGNVIPLPEGDKYLGFIFAKASAPELVEQALREAHSLLSFDIS